MPNRRFFSFILAIGLCIQAEPVLANDTAGWKIYRDDTMGFEVRYPEGWHVRAGKGTGFVTVMLDEASAVGEPHSGVQFSVQWRANPQGLPIRQWFTKQMDLMQRRRSSAADASIGGRPAVRLEEVGRLGIHFSYFVAVNRTDIFEITLIQPASRTRLDPTYRTLLSTVRFLH